MGRVPIRDEYIDRQGRTFRQFVVDQVMAEIIARGMSINQVARDAGISDMTLRRRLNNEIPFNTDDLSKVAAALGVHPAEFVKATSFLIVGDVTVDVDGDRNDIDVDIG